MSHHRRQRQRQREQLDDIFWANKAKELGLPPARARAQAKVEAQIVARVTAALTRGLEEPQRESMRYWDPITARSFAAFIDRSVFESFKRAVDRDDRTDAFRYAIPLGAFRTSVIKLNDAA